MFQKAEKKQVKLKIALTAPSGGGKTYGALLLAKGLGKKIAVIDTEKGSASLYSDRFNFDVVELSPPYTTEKYQEAIRVAEKGNYDVIIADSITHAWKGEGGLLEQKEQIDARGKGSSYTNWAMITKKQEAFIASLLHSDIHLIATMRSKQDYVLQDRNGKQVPVKVGLAPVQRDGMEYEFTCVLDIAMNHEAQASKDRTGLFKDKIFTITEETGSMLRNWMLDGKPLPQPSDIIKRINKALGLIWNDEIKKQVSEAATNAGQDVSELTRIENKLMNLPEIKAANGQKESEK
ncbi:AAA family ATPase [Candidatus Pacearchaeota archaeon]|nr:AAA family ATPase [Candidatus Pacearchaeota archaeon]